MKIRYNCSQMTINMIKEVKGDITEVKREIEKFTINRNVLLVDFNQ